MICTCGYVGPDSIDGHITYLASFADDKEMALHRPTGEGDLYSPSCPGGHGPMVRSNEPGGVIWACPTCGRSGGPAFEEG